MPIERWATFAVNDHLREKPFVADVLLYDKLIIPYPPPDDKEEQKRWREKEWSPAWLDSLVEILGDRVESVPWNEYRRTQFSDRWKAAKQAGEDAAGDAYGLTRMMLKFEFARKVSETGNPVRPVVAFHSEQDLQESIQPDVPSRVERIGIVFKHEFLCPDSDIESYTDLLRRAVDLARDDDFIKKRRALYDWQEDVVVKGYTDREARGVMKGLLADYEAAQHRASWKGKTTKFAFFVASLAVPVLREHAILTAGAALAAESGIKVIEYARSGHDDRPARGLEAAAAIHTARQELSLRAARPASP